MTRSTCDGCGRAISVAGGVTNLWTFGDRDGSDGTAMTLELADGTTHTLCFACLEALPEDPSAADVEALESSKDA